MSRLPHPFRTLRWKLTLWASVTMMLAVAVLTVIVVIQLSLADQRLIRRADVRQPLQLETMALAQQLRPLLQHEDLEEIERWVSSRRDLCSMGLVTDVVLRDGTPEQVLIALSKIAVTDREGRWLATFPTQEEAEFPTLGTSVIRAALRGEQEPSTLAVRDQGGGRTFVAAPILDRQEQVLGVLYAEADTGPLSLMTLASRAKQMLPRTLVRVAPFAVAVALILAALVSRVLIARLGRLRQVSQAWASGDLRRTVDDRSEDELGELARSLDHMAGRLNGLLDTSHKLATLEERNRLARELHDTVKQNVFSVSMLLASVEATLETDRDQARSSLVNARRAAESAGRELVALIDQLRPDQRLQDGLVQALKQYTASWSRRQGVAARFVGLGAVEAAGLAPKVEQELLRVAQEALTNVGRHARARHVAVRLSWARPMRSDASAAYLRLSVEDDGVGFNTGQVPSAGFGLESMAARMRGLRGRLEVASSRGGGTTVIAECPVAAP